jgi:hypothetical protein
MKNSKRCPKCQSKDVIRIPGEVAAYGAETTSEWAGPSSMPLRSRGIYALLAALAKNGLSLPAI